MNNDKEPHNPSHNPSHRRPEKGLGRGRLEGDRLEALARDISATRKRRQPVQENRANARMLGLAWRLMVEILAGIGVGGFVGWWMDEWFGTTPFMLLVLLLLGMVAGLLNSVRTVAEMRRKLDEQENRVQVPMKDEE